MNAEKSGALGRRLRDFLANEKALERHLDRAHPIGGCMIAIMIALSLTVILIPFVLLFLWANRNKRALTNGLRRQYQALAENARIVQGHLIQNNTLLSDKPDVCAPAMFLVCLAGNEEGDGAAGALTGRILDEVLLADEELVGDAKVVEQLIDDEEYRAFRRRPIPDGFSGRPDMVFLDVMLDAELLEERILEFGESAEVYFAIGADPGSPFLMIPQVEVDHLPIFTDPNLAGAGSDGS